MKKDYFDIKELKRDNHLNLSFRDKVYHYGILIIPVMVISLPFVWWFNKKIESPITLILILLLGILLLYSFYTLQREKLLFKIIKLEMPDDQLKLLIHKTLTALKWDFNQPFNGTFFANSGNFFTLRLTITIIYENSYLYINILDDWGYITTFGKTTRYYKKFRDQIFKEYQQYKSISSYE
jgi:hypothetical protein